MKEKSGPSVVAARRFLKPDTVSLPWWSHNAATFLSFFQFQIINKFIFLARLASFLKDLDFQKDFYF